MRPSNLLTKAADGSIVPMESAGLLFRDGSFQSDIPTKELAANFGAAHFLVSQVNAHILPFLDDPTAPCSPLYRLQRYLVNDVRARLHKLNEKEGYLPSELSCLVSQEYLGKPQDCNIFPRPRIGDLSWRILTQPSRCDVADFIQGGERMTWPHLKRIEHQTLIERTLRKAALRLQMGPDTPSVGRRHAEWNVQLTSCGIGAPPLHPALAAVSLAPEESSAVVTGTAACAGSDHVGGLRRGSSAAVGCSAAHSVMQWKPPPPLSWVPSAMPSCAARCDAPPGGLRAGCCGAALPPAASSVSPMLVGRSDGGSSDGEVNVTGETGRAVRRGASAGGMALAPAGSPQVRSQVRPPPLSWVASRVEGDARNKKGD